MASESAHAAARKPGCLGRLARRLGLLTAALIVALLIGEVAVRLFTSTTQGLQIRDTEIGRRHLRSWQGDVYSEETEREIPLRFDREGFRGPDRPFTKEPGVTRIAIFGDSMVAALEVEEEQTFVRRLEDLLRASHPQRRWEVFNFGVAGTSPGEGLVLYRNLAVRYDPDVVVGSFFVGNDLSDNCARLSTNPRIFFDLDAQGRLVQQPLSGARAGLSGWLNRNSRLYVWQKRALAKLRYKLAAAAGVSPHAAQVYATAPSGDAAHAWRISEALVRAWAQEARERGAMFVQLVVPSSAQVFDDRFEELIGSMEGERGDYDASYPGRRLGDLCRAERIPFLSLRPDFRKAAPSASLSVVSGGNSTVVASSHRCRKD